MAAKKPTKKNNKKASKNSDSKASSSAQLPFVPGKSVQPIQLQDEMERSFIDYAMSVIVARALPDARDGLKPSQRRILYAMDGLGVQLTLHTGTMTHAAMLAHVRDIARWSVQLKDALRKEKFELWFQPISYRWANNLRQYNAMEPQRFVKYYDEMAGGSGVLISKASAAR